MTDETFNCLDLLIRFSTLIAIVVGLFFTFKQLRSNAKQKTAEYLTELQKSFFSNEQVLRMYYVIEYDNFVYAKEFHGSSWEKPLDALLNHLESIAKIYLLNHFTIADLGHFAYRYLVVYQNEEVQKYFATLDYWYKQRGLKVRPFASFREVGNTIEAKYYDRSFDLNLARKELEGGQDERTN